MRTKFTILCSFILFAVCPLIMVANAQSFSEQKVRTQIIWQYDVSADTIDPKGRRISMQKFNPLGQPVVLTTFHPDGNIIQSTSLSYTENGKLQESLSTSPSMNVYQNKIYTYDINDSLIEIVSYNSDKSIKLNEKYNYADGHLVEVISRSPDNTIYVRLVFRYDAEDQLIETTGYNAQGEIITRRNYEVGSGGLNKQIMGEKGELLTTKKYNPNGNLTEEITYNSDGKTSFRTTQTYDEKGKLKEVLSDMPTVNVKTRTVFKYDDYGNCIEQVSYNKLDEPVKVIRIVYEFYD